MKKPAKDSCFFCMKRKATKLFGLRGGGWPSPMPADAKLAVCDHCDLHLSTRAKAKIVLEYVDHLRRGVPERN